VEGLTFNVELSQTLVKTFAEKLPEKNWIFSSFCELEVKTRVKLLV
jgi:hypothetical protein